MYPEEREGERVKEEREIESKSCIDRPSKTARDDDVGLNNIMGGG